MAILHTLRAYHRGHLTGVQASQRDWSPFLAHFTTWSAMSDLRGAVKSGRDLRTIAECLDRADEASFGTTEKILSSKMLLARSPSEKNGIPPCVCLSECSLPGLLSHCERYGRFGFVFSKETVFAAGGRPCVYLGRNEYTFVAELGRGQAVESPAGRLFALANFYEPRKAKHKLQDYTHEREWRLFGDLRFEDVKLEAVIAPSNYAARISACGTTTPVVPLDMLFEWGA